jgi:hypothetical protein
VWEHIYDARAATGADVLLANPFQTKLVNKSTLKTDRVESEKLARLEAFGSGIGHAVDFGKRIDALRRVNRANRVKLGSRLPRELEGYVVDPTSA